MHHFAETWDSWSGFILSAHANPRGHRHVWDERWTIPWNNAETEEPWRTSWIIIWIISTAWYERTCFVSQLVLCTAQLYPLLSGWSSWCYTWICSSLAFGTTSAKCEPKQLMHFRTSNSNKSGSSRRLHCNLHEALAWKKSFMPSLQFEFRALTLRWCTDPLSRC